MRRGSSGIAMRGGSEYGGSRVAGGMVAKDIIVELLGWTRLEAGMLGGVVIGIPGLGIIAGMLGGPVAGVQSRGIAGKESSADGDRRRGNGVALMGVARTVSHPFHTLHHLVRANYSV